MEKRGGRADVDLDADVERRRAANRHTQTPGSRVSNVELENDDDGAQDAV